MMLSRVADSLYWMARYIERAEHTARLITVHWNLMLDQGSVEPLERWQRVARMLDAPKSDLPPDDPLAIARSLVFDLGNRSSIVSSIMAARENAQQVREQISSEMFETLNRVYHSVRRSNLDDFWNVEPLDFLREVLESAHLFMGITDSTMRHGDGWHLIHTARHVERACALSQMLRVHYKDQIDDPLEWAGLLRSSTAFEAYCKVYTAELRPQSIAEFLILDADFPHSIRFCALRITRGLKEIGRSLPAHQTQRISRLAGRFQAHVEFTLIGEVLSAGVQDFLTGVIRQCLEIHKEIYHVYISYPVEAAIET
ncbi:MAG TPA: alpha-E domain-containing protein [Bryobacteraceae bacterium]